MIGVTGAQVVFNMNDHGGRRSGMDRRSFSYTLHIPEWRAEQDRRSGGLDRRSDLDRRTSEDKASVVVDMTAFKDRRDLQGRNGESP
jgi:hypothetical protein